ncbi:oxidoreductase [Reticulibacter mediterranei]|uniref:Oxidoreductase n=1 Tax=Reticulibacter mediterranei TaxID=2778369 RepID=A0A8J3IT74_9CHLR|nr:aldo/keto reductase [Reticulibacter mediterranei]GHP00054.1 oxidoreductase [Reticulibacter mediterranei]
MSAFTQARDGGMRYHRCGQSGLKLPAISLGVREIVTSNWRELGAQKYFYSVFDLGITYFDLAYTYGQQLIDVEIILGEILHTMPRDELIIATGAGYQMNSEPYGERLSKKSLMVCLDRSLKHLRLDYVDIFYIHRPDPETPLEETMGTLDLILRQGKALYIGLSSFAGTSFLNAFTTLAEIGQETVTLSQTHYDLLNRSAETNLFAHTLRTGTGVLTTCPLAQWLLAEPCLNSHRSSASLSTLYQHGQQQTQKSRIELLDKLKRLDRLARDRGQTLAQMALAWNLQHEAVTSVLIGISKVEQMLKAVISLQNLSFSEQELQMIDEITSPSFSFC